MKTFRQRVARRVRWWGISTIIVLAMMLAIGAALVNMVSGLDAYKQVPFWYVLGGLILCITFFLGQAVNCLLVRTWDTWLDDLGPTQIDVLMEEMAVKRRSMEE